jgi:hypothetical protein
VKSRHSLVAKLVNPWVRPLCRCGCKQKVNWNNNKKAWNAWLRGHSNREAPKRSVARSRVSGDGYVQVYKPLHPRAMKDGYVFLSVLIAEAKLGRPLEPNEVVYRIDRDPENDNPDNLDVRQRGYHLYRYPGDGQGSRWRRLNVDQIHEILKILASRPSWNEMQACLGEHPESDSGIARQFRIDRNVVRYIRRGKMPDWVKERLAGQYSAIVAPQPAGDPEI